jgi:hypothetical protein
LPKIVLQLGLTRRNLPAWSVVRIRSDELSDRRLRSSISRLSAAVFSRMSASMQAKALASTPMSPLAPVGTFIGAFWLRPSTARVICASGLVIERAMIAANTNATRTAASAATTPESRTAVAPAMRAG